jgi:hypothetical protein
MKMILGNMDTYMGTEDYISAAMKQDLPYSFYVHQAVSFVVNELRSLNKGLASSGRGKYEGELRIKNSEVINSEVSPYAFYINSGAFHICYKMNLDKYQEMFQDGIIKNAIMMNPNNLPFMFITLHELNHIFRDHNQFDHKGLTPSMFVKATEMDADLMAAAHLFRRIQKVYVSANDLDVRILVVISIMEALNAMANHSRNLIYQSEHTRLFDVILKVAHLKKDQFSSEPPDVNLTSDVTRYNIKMIGGFLSNYRYLVSNKDDISDFIHETIIYAGSPERAGTFESWDEIKSQV